MLKHHKKRVLGLVFPHISINSARISTIMVSLVLKLNVENNDGRCNVLKKFVFYALLPFKDFQRPPFCWFLNCFLMFSKFCQGIMQVYAKSIGVSFCNKQIEYKNVVFTKLSYNRFRPAVQVRTSYAPVRFNHAGKTV